ncbi:fibroblast growth factor receptor 1 [Schistosoma japonicum]|nr:fibroblast growth factor receptor 1 [Schistosoma japonicum]
MYLFNATMLHKSCLSIIHYCTVGSIRLLLFLLLSYETSLTLIWINGQSINSLSNSPSDNLQPRSPIRMGYLIRVGQSLNLTCPGDAVFYQWNLIDQPSQILSEEQFYTIKSATLKDSNRYVCHAVHGYGKSSVEMSVRVIDSSLITTQHECAINPKTGSVNINGPCFLTSLTDKDLNPTKSWGDQIVFDCDAVMAGIDGSLDSLIYQWEFISNANNNNNNNLRSVNQGSGSGSDTSNIVIHRQRLLVRTPSVVGVISHSTDNNKKIDLSQFHESQLRIDKLTLDHNGEYRCAVRTRLPTTGGAVTANNNQQVPPLITRQFRLTVKSRVDGSIIQGPHITNGTVEAGQDAIFHCQVNPEEHRSSTIRWGKSIDINERLAYEAEGREVIQWAGGTFVVLPSVPASLALNHNSNILSDTSSSSLSSSASSSVATALASGAVATEVSAGQSSQLVLRRASQSDSGRYVCSVLTEAGRDDHKFVQITVTGGSLIQGHKLTGSNGTHRLTLYIAIPTTVFFICLCVVTYCLISRRTAHNRRISNVRHQRNYFSAVQQSQMKPQSAASNSSVGVCRSGLNGHTTITGDNRLRPSPAGTALGTTSIGYSSINGSNSMNGGNNGPINTQLSTPNFQVNLHGAIPMIPGGYPVLIQSIGNQQPASSPFYSVPEVNSLSTYGQNVSPVTTGNNSEFIMGNINATTPNNNNNNGITCYPNGLIYPISNGHIVNPNTTNLAPNPMFNSSPESSASGINNSHIEPVEGRLMFRPHQPLMSNYNVNSNSTNSSSNNNNSNNTLRCFGYIPPGQSTGVNTSNYEMTITNTPSSLLSYPNHANA